MLRIMGSDVHENLSVFDGKVWAGDTMRFYGRLKGGALRQPLTFLDNGRALRVEPYEAQVFEMRLPQVCWVVLRQGRKGLLEGYPNESLPSTPLEPSHKAGKKTPVAPTPGSQGIVPTGVLAPLMLGLQIDPFTTYCRRKT